MKYGFSKRLRWVAAAAAALTVGFAAMPTVAQAQQTSDQWLKVCNPDPETGEQGCRVLFRIFSQTTQIADISLSYLTSAPGEIRLDVVVPTNIVVGAGLRVAVDNTAVGEAIPFFICTNQVCVVQSGVDTAFVNRLKAGGRMTLSYLQPPTADTPEGRRIDLPVTLVGFTAAYDGPGLTQEQAAAQNAAEQAARQERQEELRQRLIEQQNLLNANP